METCSEHCVWRSPRPAPSPPALAVPSPELGELAGGSVSPFRQGAHVPISHSLSGAAKFAAAQSLPPHVLAAGHTLEHGFLQELGKDPLSLNVADHFAFSEPAGPVASPAAGSVRRGRPLWNGEGDGCLPNGAVSQTAWPVRLALRDQFS